MLRRHSQHQHTFRDRRSEIEARAAQLFQEKEVARDLANQASRSLNGLRFSLRRQEQDVLIQAAQLSHGLERVEIPGVSKAIRVIADQKEQRRFVEPASILLQILQAEQYLDCGWIKRMATRKLQYFVTWCVDAVFSVPQKAPHVRVLRSLCGASVASLCTGPDNAVMFRRPY